MANYYQQVSDERYDILMKRYEKFQIGLEAPHLEPVKVFDPLPQKLIDELELIREVSRFLQKKKEEDLNKAAQAAQEAEADAKKAKEDAAKEVEKKDD